MGDGSLFSVDGDLLAAVVVAMTEVRLQHTGLSGRQCDQLFAAVVAGAEKTRLRSLDLGGVDLSGVGPGLLAASLTSLQEVNLGGCDLGPW